MSKELIEKLSAIREDLLTLSAQVSDVKKLAGLVKQKMPTMRPAYEELYPYMTGDQRSRADWVIALDLLAGGFLEEPEGKDHLTGATTTFIPHLIADLDDIALKLKQPPNPKAGG